MVYKKISKQEQLNLVSLLNWDYNDTSEDLLKLINTAQNKDCSFTQETLFARSLETLKWNDLVNLWTIEKCIALYSPKIRRMIRSRFLRDEYDRVFSILQGKSLSYTEQNSERVAKLKSAFLFNRRNCTKQRVL